MADPKLKRGEVLAWHFVRENRRLGYDDDNIVAPGYVYEVEGPIALCDWGLHASINPLHALRYACGPIVCRVVMSGDIIRGDDKLAAARREVLWMADATDVLGAFARRCALDVIHLWDAPDIVRRYLTTGDESLRDAAWAAARDAPWGAPRTKQARRLRQMLMALED